MKGIDPELAAWGMANDPEFAKYAQSQIQGQQLAKASQGVEDFLKQRELQRQETFRNTPSDVPIPMRAPEYQPPSGIEQFNERLRAMMQSGNPELQKRAGALRQRGYMSPSSDSSTTSIKEWKLARSQGYKGSLQDWKMLNKPSGTTINVGTEGERSSDAYYSRMRNVRLELERQGLDPESGRGFEFIKDEILNTIPFGGFFMSDDGQLRKSLERDWIMANARDESGATINIDEWENYRDTFFPSIGDSKATAEQKRRLRLQTEKGMKSKAGSRAGVTETVGAGQGKSGLPEGFNWE